MKKVSPFITKLITLNKIGETPVIDRKNFLTCIIALSLGDTEGKLKAKIMHGDTADGKGMKQYTIKGKEMITEELTKQKTNGQFYFDLTGAKQYIKITVEGAETKDAGIAVALGDKISGEGFN